MKIRERFTVLLLLLGLILALLQLSANRSFTVSPKKLITEVTDSGTFFSVDQVAKFVTTEDSTVQIIDLRLPEEFRKLNIPGSINVPYGVFISSDPDLYLNKVNIKTIFYSNGDFDSNYAMMFAMGLGYDNTSVMKGGLNEWFTTIMESKFTGERISARENAMFETRLKAGKLFTQINSLPDSLKIKFMETRKFSSKKLDGGCE